MTGRKLCAVTAFIDVNPSDRENIPALGKDAKLVTLTLNFGSVAERDVLGVMSGDVLRISSHIRLGEPVLVTTEATASIDFSGRQQETVKITSIRIDRKLAELAL